MIFQCGAVVLKHCKKTQVTELNGLARELRQPSFYYTCSKRVFCTQQVCVIASPAHVHLHDGVFLLIEAAVGTMHRIWPSRFFFFAADTVERFLLVSAFHFSSPCSQIKAISPPSQIHSIFWKTIKAAL